MENDKIWKLAQLMPKDTQITTDVPFCESYNDIYKKEAYLHYNQYIQRITVFTKRARNESIVVRVNNWWIQHTVHLHMHTDWNGKEEILELARNIASQ